ncbi:HAMP domain-containing histidine kinase [Burkholderia thailandensis]|uniref:sensor histidine kinase n=1 Tax=Burkholderia thailandensis TaxID=57975 RepID=UPI00031AE9EC|nr:HAMP domain-containing sensor histidine kinase [Burkholderia thailandensis]AHI67736.1 HAMP domain protein [Burkholderia thailandensis H0587]AOJ54947.1 histidine kinase [Burkholderia thailandensis]MCS3392583.1 HAMP domain-containing histidine kinase [Burkholderia thailandensis]MCS6425499.1 HAMP domain-containing histidine kinase [Burkholderia thailandensis]MCS6453870.1 HAMP domain-containing histidine kinase [Burkholderia thailandensis]
MPRSLRVKVALFFSGLTIVLLIAQALGVKTLAEAQEEKLITALIHDDLANLVRSYRGDPALMPPFDPRLNGYVSAADRPQFALPDSVRQLADGTHEIILEGREIHVAIVPFGPSRIYRVFNFSAYERRFKQVINALMAGTGVFALLTIWCAFWVSGLLVRQIAGLAQQVKTLRLGGAESINPGKYDEAEVAELVDAFNDYHRRMAEMVEREKAFTGNVSHELRTPLTVIKTSCELLEHDASISAKSRARVRQIERAADGMKDLVDALLLLAREKLPADVGPVRLVTAIGNALDPVAAALKAKGIQPRIDVAPDLHVEANGSVLGLVLSNLVDNAVRYTGRGRIDFSFAHGWLHIEDTGRGIAPNALPHVFDRGYRANSADPAAPGFGIGLSIVKKICDRHGWAIRIDSEPDRGTRVSLRLPLASPPDVSSPRSTSASS